MKSSHDLALGLSWFVHELELPIRSAVLAVLGVLLLLTEVTNNLHSGQDWHMTIWKWFEIAVLIIFSSHCFEIVESKLEDIGSLLDVLDFTLPELSPCTFVAFFPLAFTFVAVVMIAFVRSS